MADCLDGIFHRSNLWAYLRYHFLDRDSRQLNSVWPLSLCRNVVCNARLGPALGLVPNLLFAANLYSSILGGDVGRAWDHALGGTSSEIELDRNAALVAES